ncbi:hypothetical protein ACFLTZ_01085 [Chloroflexota bacterium]
MPPKIFLIVASVIFLAVVMGLQLFLDGSIDISSAIVAWGTATLVVVSIVNINENRHLIAENRRLQDVQIRATRHRQLEQMDRESKKRRIGEVQAWVKEVITLKSRYAIGERGEELKRSEELNIIFANKEYIQGLALSLDTELSKEDNELLSCVNRIFDILEECNTVELTGDAIQKIPDNNIVEALSLISKYKTKSQL